MHTWKPRTLIIVLLLASALALSQGTRQDLSDQIVINTQRLYDLERRMNQIEHGSALAADTAARATIHDIRLDAVNQDIHDIRSVLIGVAVFVMTHLVGFVVYLLKTRISIKPDVLRNRHGQ